MHSAKPTVKEVILEHLMMCVIKELYLKPDQDENNCNSENKLIEQPFEEYLNILKSQLQTFGVSNLIPEAETVLKEIISVQTNPMGLAQILKAKCK